MADHGQRIEPRPEIFGAEAIDSFAYFVERLAFPTSTRDGNLTVQNTGSAGCKGERDSFRDVEHIPGPGRKYDGVAQRLVSFTGKLIWTGKSFSFPVLVGRFPLRVQRFGHRNVSDFGVGDGLSEQPSDSTPINPTVPIPKLVKPLGRQSERASKDKSLKN
jgi:hypothetical protein